MASLSRAGMDRGTDVGAAARFAGQVGRDGDRAEPRRRAEQNTDRRAVRTAHARRLTGVSDPGPWPAAGPYSCRSKSGRRILPARTPVWTRSLLTVPSAPISSMARELP